MAYGEEELVYSDILVWADLETTGITDHDLILEVAVIVTDNELVEIDHLSSPVLSAAPERFVPANQPRTSDDQISVWENHFESGLIADLHKASNSAKTPSTVDEELVTLLEKHGVYQGMERKRRPPLCGASVSFDRRFMRKYMPNFIGLLHYRNIDVSSIHELRKRWRGNDLPPMDEEEAPHRALQDIRNTLEYLRYMREKGFIG